MILFDFFRDEVKADYRPLLALLVCSGLANASLLIFINLGAEYAFSESIKLVLLAGYVVALLVYVLAQRYTLDKAIAAVEAGLAEMKVRLFNKLQQKELAFIEQHHHMSDFASLVKDSNLLAQGTTQFILAIQNAIVVLIASIYLAFLSVTTFYLLIGALLVALPFYAANIRKSRHCLQSSTQQESSFLRHIQAMLQGFTLLKLDDAEATGLAQSTQSANQQASTSRLAFNTHMVENIIFSNAVFYVFLWVIVFILPMFISEHQALLYSIISTLLFIMVPLLMLVVVVPMLARTTQNLSSLYALEKKLDQAPSVACLVADQSSVVSTFKSLALHNVSFQYLNPQQQSLFSAGPFNLRLQAGELVFLVGQNGSGKSTFLKLLSGLYVPHGGTLLLNDQPVAAVERTALHELFSPVFADFHLFDELYGISDQQAAEVAFWLREMQLEAVTRFDGRRFSHTRLSTGLCKRLAFVVAVSKQRPICLLDEVAADQDPAFRQHFYHHILPLLKQRGHTVILVSHDHDYWSCADRVIRFEQGQIIADERLSYACYGKQ